MKCLDCDVMIDPSPTGRGPLRKRCGFHRDLRKKQLQRARTAQLRAEEWGVVAELVIADEVFARDNWNCHLCNKPVPEHLRPSAFRAGVYEPLSPVVDHVIPLSKGGPHTMANCSTAHFRCNAHKFDGEGLRPTEVEQRVEESQPAATNPCKIEGCSRQARLKQMCGRHYSRNNRYGHPLKMKCACGCGEIVLVPPDWIGIYYIDGHGVQSNAVTPAEQLHERLVAQPVSDRGRQFYNLTDDCLVWTGPQNKRGYGFINIREAKRTHRRKGVHRLAYELAHGEGSATGLTIDHLCGVPLCCNPNHLEAVSQAENLRRAALNVTACPQGHTYDEVNTLVVAAGYRVCRQCNRNYYHQKVHGHDFVLDETNPSDKRERCLVCLQAKESTPQFCPYGHEYTPENKRIDTKGKRACNQCLRDRTHVPQFGHSFVPDPSNPSEKRERCLICVQNTEPATHCVNGHEYTDLTTEYTKHGQRNCVQCRLNTTHIPQRGHEYVIDPHHTGKLRRCLVCRT